MEIDNNLTEQEIKLFVISRKNFLFASTVRGAKTLCNHFGLIRSAIANGLDPYHYYVAALNALPYCKTVDDYEALLRCSHISAYAALGCSNINEFQLSKANCKQALRELPKTYFYTIILKLSKLNI